MEKRILYKRNDAYHLKIEDLKNISPLMTLSENLRLDIRDNISSIENLIDWYKKITAEKFIAEGFSV